MGASSLLFLKQSKEKNSIRGLTRILFAFLVFQVRDAAGLNLGS